jgi:leucyl aminopeptidase
VNFIIDTADIKNIKASSLIKFCDSSGYKQDCYLRELDKALGGAVRSLYDSGEFEGKLNQTVVLHTGSRLPAGRVILAGLGEKGKADADSYRQAAGTISRLPAVENSASLAFFLGAGESGKIASAIVEGFNLGSFRMRDYKSDSEKEKNRLQDIYFFGKNQPHLAALDKAIMTGRIISDSVILARRLASHPGNFLTPKKFASEAESLAKKYRFRCRVLDEKKIRSERMGAFLGVAQGSSEPPRFVIMEYRGRKSGSRPVVLIGKGITFDTGGISLKARQDMHEMKGDMQGGAVVLATMMAVARLKLPLNIVGLVPLAENMPSSKALKPDDIVKSRKGLTVEIINTDAEGRLILADALDYANEFRPQAVIDIATLTGGALYVLGYAGAPIMGNNKDLMNAIRAASEATAERVWEMPIWDEYREAMKSSIADLKNSGGKPAATITAAAFLENFIGDWPWAHIDIAYVDVEKTGRPYIPKGPTGIGLRLLVELLANWKKPKS